MGKDDKKGKSPLHDKTNFKRGLKVGFINVRGIVSSVTKRVELNHWIELNQLDVVCIQEWFVPHGKQTYIEKKMQENIDISVNTNGNVNKNGNVNRNDNVNVNSENDSYSENEDFENEKKYDKKYLEISLDMAAFPKYQKIEKDSKTIILYRTGLGIIEFNQLSPLSDTGIDVTWIGVETKRDLIIIGSVYHSPSFECEYDEITYQLNHIKKVTKNYKHTTTILGGDWNAKHQLWGSSITDNRGRQLIDWITTNDMQYCNDGTYTYVSKKKKDVLDVTMITTQDQNLVKQWFVQDIPSNGIDRNGKKKRYSDHRGIIMVLNSDPRLKLKPTRVTWNLDVKKVPKFREKLLPKINEWNKAYDILHDKKENVNLLVEYFQLIIVETAREVFGFKKFNGESVNWVDKKVHNLLQKKKKIGNKISHDTYKIKKRFKNRIIPKHIKQQLKKQKKKLRKIQKKLKKKRFKNILKSTENIERLLNNNNVNKEKLFYNTVSKISHRKVSQIPPIRDPKSNEIIAQTDMEIANKLHDHYTTPLKRNKYNDDHIAFHGHVENMIENYKINRNKNDSLVNRKFTEQEVMRVITCINIQSAMAFDFIHYQLLSWVKHIILSSLTLIFNLIFFIHQICPSIWKFSEYVPVPKPGRDHSYCKNIRPIAILPCLGRLMGKCLCNRLLTDCIQRKILSKYNCAFQCNRGPDDIFNNLTESIYQALQNGHFLEIIFKDLKSAYDSVWINGLLYRLIYEYGYDGNIIAWYMHFFSDRFTRVKYNGKKTQWRKALRNLPQGQTDSTILFVLFLNNIDLVNIDKLAKNLKLNLKSDYNSNKNKNNNNKNADNNNNNSNNNTVTQIDYTIYDENNNKNNKDNNINSANKDNNNVNGSEDKPIFRNFEKFRINGLNFADDCCLAMQPMMKQVTLTNEIKYNYRLNLQSSAYGFFHFTRYFKLVVAKSKCSTVTFSRKRFFHAYVYKLDGENLELVHSHINGPQKCKHNERTQYLNPMEDLIESNGDSDLENLDIHGEKMKKSENMEAQDPKNPIFKIRKTGKHSKRQKQSKHKLPESVRILGVHFDPQLYFDDHLKIVINKTEKKLHCLMKLAYCRYYRFKPSTIMKLFESVIRPKLEYALCTTSNQTKLNEISKIQKRAMRIALQVKKQTPTWYLMETTNSKPMVEKWKELQIKLWHKYKRAPSNLLQHETFNRWKQYIIENDPLCMNDNGIMQINPARLNYISKSPLSHAYNTVKSLYPKYRNILSIKNDSVMRPPPVYQTIYPSNININNNSDLNKIAKMEMNEFLNANESGNFVNKFDFYTDGSCIPNPGPGGAAYYSPNFLIKSKIHIIDHDTTINYGELLGIKMVVHSIKNYIDFCINRNIEVNINYINIYTDSKFVCDILDIDGYPKYDYYYQLIEEIFKICHFLYQNNIFININKINSHIGIEGNTIADKLAKQAAKLAEMCKYGDSKIIKYDMKKNPIQVDIAKDLIRLRRKRKEERKMFMIKMKNMIKTKQQDRYYGKGIFTNSIIDFEYKIRNKSNIMKKELEYLSKKECEIIMKLRTEYINLNHYLHHINYHTDGNCDHCGVPETVSHFLIDCPGFKESALLSLHKDNTDFTIARQKMRKRLKKLAIYFKYDKNFNAENLLFPHLWQGNPIKEKNKGENYLKLKEKYLKKRVLILKTVINFVNSTRRFNNDFGI